LATDFQINKKILREKISTDLHMTHNGGLFKISSELLAFVQTWPIDELYLEDAYEKAVWANPVTRQKEMSRVQTEQQAALKAKAIAEAEAKKKAASTTIRNRDSQRTPTGPRATMNGLDSALRETMREIKSRH
jgi:hypothetical protein